MMTLLKSIEANPTTEPKLVSPAADRVVEGSPSFRVWKQDEDRGGQIRSGVWEASIGSFRTAKGKSCEFCYILEGVMELTEEGQGPIVYQAGDSFVMKSGFVGIWKTIEPIRKIFVIVD